MFDIMMWYFLVKYFVFFPLQVSATLQLSFEAPTSDTFADFGLRYLSSTVFVYPNRESSPFFFKNKL